MLTPWCLLPTIQGSNPLHVDGALGCTALHYAAMHGHVNVARALLPRGELEGQRYVRVCVRVDVGVGVGMCVGVGGGVSVGGGVGVGG